MLFMYLFNSSERTTCMKKALIIVIVMFLTLTLCSCSSNDYEDTIAALSSKEWTSSIDLTEIMNTVNEETAKHAKEAGGFLDTPVPFADDERLLLDCTMTVRNDGSVVLTFGVEELRNDVIDHVTSALCNSFGYGFGGNRSEALSHIDETKSFLRRTINGSIKAEDLPEYLNNYDAYLLSIAAIGAIPYRMKTIPTEFSCTLTNNDGNLELLSHEEPVGRLELLDDGSVKLTFIDNLPVSDFSPIVFPS